MTKNEKNASDFKNPNFILCDMGLQNAFARMCQKFTEQTKYFEPIQKDWLIIDNDTGEIIKDKP